MVYFLFFLSAGLMTALTLVSRKLQHQKLENRVERQKRKEAVEESAKERDELIRANAQISQKMQILQHQKNEEITVERQSLEQVRLELAASQESCEQLQCKIQSLQDEQSVLRKNNKDQAKTIDGLYEEIGDAIDKGTNALKEENELLEQEIQDYKQEIKELKSNNYRLTIKNETRNSGQRLNSEKFVTLNMEEHDLYSQERLEILVDILKSSLRDSREGSRRRDIISDIILNNETDAHREAISAEIKGLFRDYRSMSERMRKALEGMGFEIVSEKKHYKVVFCQDSRYTYTFAKTASDHRAGQNVAADICNLFL